MSDFPVEQYLEIQKKMPGARYIIMPTIENIFQNGDLANGKRIFDAGCGQGFYAKKFLNWGAESVHGIDLSPEMIEEAKRNVGDSRNAFFEIGSISELKTDELSNNFDLITAIFVLHFISNRETLRKTIMDLGHLLKSGGHFVACFPNFVPGFRWTKEEAMKYGISMQFDEQVDLKDGQKSKISILNGARVVREIEAYLWLPETYFQFLKEAGFENIEFVNPIVSEEGLSELGNEFFHEYLNPPKDIFVTATKK